MKKTISIVLVLVLGMVAEVAKADFTFGTPTKVPNVNTSSEELNASISADGLSLYFISNRSGGIGERDIWVATRETTDDEWGEPVNLGPTINTPAGEWGVSISYDGLSLYFDTRQSGTSSAIDDLWVATRETTNDDWANPVNLGPTVNSSGDDYTPSISSDGLTLYFTSQLNPGGYGLYDLWATTRATIHDPWGSPVNLGPTVNTSAYELDPCISPERLILFFTSVTVDGSDGGYGQTDIWMTTRETTVDDWGEPVNLGPIINSSAFEGYPNVSADGSTLFFRRSQSGRKSGGDIWQAPIEPVCDLNNDNKVDLADMHVMVDHWGENYPLCDIGPTPLGDGVVDIHDFIVLTEHLYRLTAHWKLDETDGNIAYDSFGDYDGTINGNPSWLPTGGIKGGSLMMDGIDDYIETPFILDPSKGSFSVLAWVYCWMPGQVIISQRGQSGGTWLGTNPSGKLMTGLSDVNFGALESDSFITDVQWHHVGFVYDMDTLHRRLYVDGILVAEDNSAVSGVPSNEGQYIGASKDLEAGTLFSGFIDDVRIYNQALNTKEIEAMMY